MEYNDIYDHNRRKTGRKHLRGTPWRKGEYGLVTCVWVYDGNGKVLLTKRAPEKSFPGTWENSGGAVRAGESSIQAIVRELREETGIRAEEHEFELLEYVREGFIHYDHYCLYRDIPVEQVVLQPGETDAVRWASFEEIHEMIRRKEICSIIAKQFIRQEPLLRDRQNQQ